MNRVGPKLWFCLFFFSENIYKIYCQSHKILNPKRVNSRCSDLEIYVNILFLVTTNRQPIILYKMVFKISPFSQ